jgi:hypothetical protein
MRAIAPSFAVNRRVLLSALASLPVLSAPLVPAATLAQTAPSGGLLPSWTDGPAKQAIFDFVRAKVVGTAGGTKYGYAKDGKPFLTKEAKLLLNDNNAGKPEGIHLMIGRRPYAAFGNSTGDRQMLEWTGAGAGARLKMLVLHDDAAREYAYGPAQGLPDSKVGTFTQALYNEAKKDGWTVISMKNDWKRIFAFE